MSRSANAPSAGATTSPPALVWRPMTAADLPAVVALADAVHVDHPEDNAVFAERLALFPAGCLVLESAGVLAGYVVAHPWRMREPPALDTRLGALPADPDCLYLHDIALAAAARGHGAAGVAIDRLAALAGTLDLPALALIAVAGTLPFWSHLGFTIVDEPGLAARLATYDAEARLMRRDRRGPLDRRPESETGRP